MIHVLVLAGLLLVGGCASQSVREPPTPLADIQGALRVSELWSVDVGASGRHFVALAPTLVENVIYAAGADGRVSAYAADTGSRIWETELDLPISGATGVGEGLVLVGTREGAVVALAGADGKHVWTAGVSSEVLAPPAATAGVVVVQTVDGKVYGLSAADGKRRWLYERTEPALSLRGTARPLVVNDVVLTGFAGGRLVALRLDDGKLLWEIPVAQPRGRNEIERLVDVDVQPLVVGETIYAASYQGKIIAVNPRTGTITWSRDLSTYTGLASDGRYLYVTDDRGGVLALDLASGANIWRQDGLRGRGLNAPAVHGDFVVVGDFEGYVHWLAREDGHIAGRHRPAGAAIRAAALASSDTVYVVGLGGTLSALRLIRG